MRSSSFPWLHPLKIWSLRENPARFTAHHDPQEQRLLLKEFKGIGDVRVDIFFREAQLAWDELYPFADRRALHAASALGLGNDAEALARLVDPPEFVRLMAALVRCDLGKHADEILAEAERDSDEIRIRVL